MIVVLSSVLPLLHPLLIQNWIIGIHVSPLGPSHPSHLCTCRSPPPLSSLLTPSFLAFSSLRADKQASPPRPWEARSGPTSS